MIRKLNRLFIVICVVQSIFLCAQVDPAQFSAMKWRNIGPYRAGKVNAVSGIPGDPATFYFGASGGGVWKTTDSGTTWKPLFDRENVSSIGALAVSTSNPKVIYAGTGENDITSEVAFGNGVYKSSDGGATWKHIGLEDTQHIARVRVDPRNPEIVLAAAMGHTFDANQERGIFRSTDGGRTWKKTLYKDDVTGAVDICLAPDDAHIVYASLWQAVYKPSDPEARFGAGSGIYKSTDEGATWKQVGGKGLPSEPLGRIGVAVAPGSHGRKVFAIIEGKEKGSGLYVTTDGGETWQRATTDERIVGFWYMSEIFIDPRDANVVYVPLQSLYKSTDGGKTFTVLKGAPGGDDYHTMWIDPTNSNHIMLGVDQGATISLNGGETWSTWYNQPTGQFYRVATDHFWPYWIYGPQQDSGTAGIASRGNDGQITERDWFPVGWGESGYTIPDPTDPDVVFNAGPAGSMVRVSKRTGQARDISPAPIPYGTKYRLNWNTPLVFSPQDPHLLYVGTQFVMQTTDGGTTWKGISPDLTRTPADEKNPKKMGSLMTVAPSPVQEGVIWTGSNDGYAQITRDGGATWKNVTPEAVTHWSAIPLIEASSFDAATAFMAVDRMNLGDFKPHIYQTHDFGQTWQETVGGICDVCVVRSVREDPERRNLLYAGTERGVYFSMDAGAHWQSLKLNMPMAAVQDLAIEQGDLIAATYGRALWILDDLSPLRQYEAGALGSKAELYRPRAAIRVRRDENQDTPLPPEVPAGKNPPDGAILYYSLPAGSNSNVKLEIYAREGKLVRAYSSASEPDKKEQPLQVAEYWVGHSQPMPKGPGLHRFVWDLRYSTPEAVHVMTPYNYPMGAIVGETPLPPFGPLVLPGRYEVRLTVDGELLKQEIEVKMDPRVNYRRNALEKALNLQLEISETLGRNYAAYEQMKDLHDKLAALGKAQDATGKKAIELDKKVAALLGGSAYILDIPTEGTVMTVNDSLISLAGLVDGADFAPSAESFTAFERVCGAMNTTLAKWEELKSKELAEFRKTANEIPEYPVLGQEKSCSE